jgi:hypothetical protein
MKKFVLFVLLAGIAAFYGFSQSLSLADSLGPIANNSTLVKSGTISDVEIVSHIFVKNNTGAPVDVQVKKVELSVVPGSMNTFCWGLCFSPSVYVTSTPITIASNWIDSLGFSGHYSPQEVTGITHMRYVFFKDGDPTDSVCVNVDYAAFPVGMESVSRKGELSNAYPNPAGSTTAFSFNLPEGTTGSIMFRDVLGSMVKNVNLNGTQGKISVATDNLRDGIYFYSLLVNGKSTQTKKLIVKH